MVRPWVQYAVMVAMTITALLTGYFLPHPDVRVVTQTREVRVPVDPNAVVVQTPTPDGNLLTDKEHHCSWFRKDGSSYYYRLSGDPHLCETSVQ
jgi:hypothetical protein